MVKLGPEVEVASLTDITRGSGADEQSTEGVGVGVGIAIGVGVAIGVDGVLGRARDAW